MTDIAFTITNKISVPYRPCAKSELLDDFIYNSLTMLNPVWLENHRLGRFNWKTPKELYFYEEEGKDDLFVPRGFLVDIIQCCEKKQIEYKIENKTIAYENINWEFSGALRPFQKIAIKEMLSEDIGTLCAPTGSGKTVMGIYMITKRKQPTIIIVHTKELLFQWRERLKQFTNIEGHQIGMIGDGHLDEDKDITIALIQTLRNHPEMIDQYGHLIIDECHRIPSKTHTNIASQFKGKYMTGLSATPFRRDGLSKVIEWYAGPILHKIEPKDLIESGHIVPIKSIIRKTNFISMLEDPSAEYSKLLQELSLDEERNKMIVDDVLNEMVNGETCLVLTDRKNHCEELNQIMISQGMKVAKILTGDVPAKRRKQIIEWINDGKVPVVIATGQLIGEGFDCKNLSCLFLTLPIRFSGRIIQYIGRVLRPMKSKDKALIYDYFDESVRCLYGSYKARIKEYKKLEVKKGG